MFGGPVAYSTKRIPIDIFGFLCIPKGYFPDYPQQGGPNEDFRN